ncbi:hypothetical protein CEF21_09465 [Bacillus sp. FJAT-42376]|uniref:hypothetical protein n=1 Tax=Bacillus sp. FJAT-42376 TaxID=2014076 RepID=UPI000F50C92B|nr:hypothetical protein [Bacillus sp. FJAT-42376]AZB42495.1 hypothetical protein CEF21_09465 [Bacillus sp. FJAT-42376]
MIKKRGINKTFQSITEAAALTVYRREVYSEYKRFLHQLRLQLQALHSLLHTFSLMNLDQWHLLKTKKEIQRIHLDLQLLLTKEFVFSNDLKRVWLSQILKDLDKK